MLFSSVFLSAVELTTVPLRTGRGSVLTEMLCVVHVVDISQIYVEYFPCSKKMKVVITTELIVIF